MVHKLSQTFPKNKDNTTVIINYVYYIISGIAYSIEKADLNKGIGLIKFISHLY